MNAGNSRRLSSKHLLSAVFLSGLLASCSATTGDPTLGLDNTAQPSTTQSVPAQDEAALGSRSLAGEQARQIDGEEAAAAPASFVEQEKPVTVASAASEAAAVEEGVVVATVGETATQAAESAALTDAVAEASSSQVDPSGERFGEAKQPVQPAGQAAATALNGVVAGEGATGASEAVAQAPAATPTQTAQTEKKKGFLSAFFSPAQANAAGMSKQTAASPMIETETKVQALVSQEPEKPLVNLASVAPMGETADKKPRTLSALPGVRTTELFEITRRSGIDDDSDVDLHEDEQSFEVASAAGMARLAPNGLVSQTEHVDVACLKPALVRVLKTIESHYGRKPVVTSGFRDANRNRRARGARNSLHMACAAADIQVTGVSKVELATFVRSMPGRGGVGTYCHTNSVHVDIGPERDWNWRCRRRG